MIKQPHVLVTNDDGIDSHFLYKLVQALSGQFKVSVAAPTYEQSWIGRAVSRHKEVSVAVDSRFGAEVDAWSINGTPTDCVNIALGNLLNTRPDIVVSGINIGYNTTETLVLSSGTVAGAIEGALWGIPAIAFSQCVPRELFAAVTESKGRIDSDFSSTLDSAANHASRISIETLKSPPAKGALFNINFPANTQTDTIIRDTYPAKIQLGSLYQEVAPGKYRFRFTEGIMLDTDERSDRMTLDAGFISRSLLDFSRAGRPSS